MMRTMTIALLGLCLFAAPATAQAWPQRMWVTVSGGLQNAAAGGFSDSFTLQQYTETGQVAVHAPVKNGGLFAGSFGVRVWQRLGVGFMVTRSTSTGTATIDASIPHPLYDNQPRSISGSSPTHHNETGAHVQLAMLLPLSPRIRVILSGGPSMLKVEQTVVSNVQYSQSYPYDTASFTSATASLANDTVIGFNVGGDVAWMFSKSLGAGMMAQYAGGTAKLNAGGGRTVSVKAGGACVGAGIRASF